MPRKPLLRNDFLPYHITGRSNNRETFHLPLSKLWNVLGSECWNLSKVHQGELHAIVLMPNHFHMIMTVPEHDLGVLMNHFMSTVTRRANLISGRSGHLFGGPYHWSLIEDTRYYGHALKYVYRNPIKAGLCDNVEDYPFSTLHGLTGRAHLPFPIHLTRPGMEIALPTVEPLDQLEWLNRPFPAEAEAMIQKGLRQKRFTTLLDRSTRVPSAVLAGLL